MNGRISLTVVLKTIAAVNVEINKVNEIFNKKVGNNNSVVYQRSEL